VKSNKDAMEETSENPILEKQFKIANILKRCGDNGNEELFNYLKQLYISGYAKFDEIVKNLNEKNRKQNQTIVNAKSSGNDGGLEIKWLGETDVIKNILFEFKMTILGNMAYFKATGEEPNPLAESILEKINHIIGNMDRVKKLGNNGETGYVIESIQTVNRFGVRSMVKTQYRFNVSKGLYKAVSQLLFDQCINEGDGDGVIFDKNGGYRLNQFIRYIEEAIKGMEKTKNNRYFKRVVISSRIESKLDWEYVKNYISNYTVYLFIVGYIQLYPSIPLVFKGLSLFVILFKIIEDWDTLKNNKHTQFDDESSWATYRFICWSVLSVSNWLSEVWYATPFNNDSDDISTLLSEVATYNDQDFKEFVNRSILKNTTFQYQFAITLLSIASSFMKDYLIYANTINTLTNMFINSLPLIYRYQISKDQRLKLITWAVNASNAIQPFRDAISDPSVIVNRAPILNNNNQEKFKTSEGILKDLCLSMDIFKTLGQKIIDTYNQTFFGNTSLDSTVRKYPLTCLLLMWEDRFYTELDGRDKTKFLINLSSNANGTENLLINAAKYGKDRRQRLGSETFLSEDYNWNLGPIFDIGIFIMSAGLGFGKNLLENYTPGAQNRLLSAKKMPITTGANFSAGGVSFPNTLALQSPGSPNDSLVWDYLEMARIDPMMVSEQAFLVFAPTLFAGLLYGKKTAGAAGAISLTSGLAFKFISEVYNVYLKQKESIWGTTCKKDGGIGSVTGSVLRLGLEFGLGIIIPPNEVYCMNTYLPYLKALIPPNFSNESIVTSGEMKFIEAKKNGENDFYVLGTKVTWYLNGIEFDKWIHSTSDTGNHLIGPHSKFTKRDKIYKFLNFCHNNFNLNLNDMLNVTRSTSDGETSVKQIRVLAFLKYFDEKYFFPTGITRWDSENKKLWNPITESNNIYIATFIEYPYTFGFRILTSEFSLDYEMGDHTNTAETNQMASFIIKKNGDPVNVLYQPQYMLKWISPGFLQTYWGNFVQTNSEMNPEVLVRDMIFYRKNLNTVTKNYVEQRPSLIREHLPPLWIGRDEFQPFSPVKAEGEKTDWPQLLPWYYLKISFEPSRATNVIEFLFSIAYVEYFKLNNAGIDENTYKRDIEATDFEHIRAFFLILACEVDQDEVRLHFNSVVQIPYLSYKRVYPKNETITKKYIAKKLLKAVETSNNLHLHHWLNETLTHFLGLGDGMSEGVRMVTAWEYFLKHAMQITDSGPAASVSSLRARFMAKYHPATD
jgi:hypothetical protein